MKIHWLSALFFHSTLAIALLDFLFVPSKMSSLFLSQIFWNYSFCPVVHFSHFNDWLILQTKHIPFLYTPTSMSSLAD